MSPLVRRVFSGFGANVFGQCVTVITQLLSVPIFLHYWDAATYGEWLMLSAVPAYFSMADIGLVAVAANKMTMLSARGEHKASNRLFQSALVMTVVLISGFAVIAVTSVLLIGPYFNMSDDSKYALLMLIGVALINVFSGLIDAVFRADGKYALGTYALNFARIFEFFIGLVFLINGFGFLGVAFGLLLGRTLASSLILIYAMRTLSNFKWSTEEARREEAMLLVRPAIAFMAFPLGNAISIQGMSLLVGTMFGPVFLAVFNTYRTLSRVLVQLITTVSRSVWPEISRLYGAREISKIRSINQFTTLSMASGSVVMAVIIYSAAPWILDEWTHGKIPFNSILLAFFLMSTVMTSFWQLAMVVTMACNQHERLAYFYLGSSILVIIVAVGLSEVVGEYSSALALIVFEIVMLFAAQFAARRVLDGELR